MLYKYREETDGFAVNCWRVEGECLPILSGEARSPSFEISRMIQSGISEANVTDNLDYRSKRCVDPTVNNILR